MSKTVESVIKSIKKEEKEHPIKTKLRRIYYRIKHCVEYIRDIPLNIKLFIQRGKRGYANCDWWNFDYYISKIIIGCLKKLKKQGHGLPIWQNGRKSEKVAIREWDEILDNIIYTFETALKIIEFDLIYIPLKEFTWKQYKKEVRFVKRVTKKYPGYARKVMTKKEVKRFEKGFDLFKEYFFSLWD